MTKSWCLFSKMIAKAEIYMLHTHTHTQQSRRQIQGSWTTTTTRKEEKRKEEEESLTLTGRQNKQQCRKLSSTKFRSNFYGTKKDSRGMQRGRKWRETKQTRKWKNEWVNKEERTLSDSSSSSFFSFSPSFSFPFSSLLAFFSSFFSSCPVIVSESSSSRG